MGTLYVNKQGRIRLSGMEASDFAPQSAIAQSFALGHNFPTRKSVLRWPTHSLSFSFLFSGRQSGISWAQRGLERRCTERAGSHKYARAGDDSGRGALQFACGRTCGSGAFLFPLVPLAFIPFLRSQSSFKERSARRAPQNCILPAICGADNAAEHLPGSPIGSIAACVDLLGRSVSPTGKALVTTERNREASDGRPASERLSFSQVFCWVRLPLWNAPVFIAAAAVVCCLL